MSTELNTELEKIFDDMIEESKVSEDKILEDPEAPEREVSPEADTEDAADPEINEKTAKDVSEPEHPEKARAKSNFYRAFCQRWIDLGDNVIITDTKNQ